MSVRIRIMLLLLVVGLIPLLVGSLVSRVMTNQLHDYSVGISQDAVRKSGTSGVNHYSNLLARQVKDYLAEHPEVSPGDPAVFQSDPYIHSLTKHTFGYTGQSLVYDNTLMVHFSRDEKLAGKTQEELRSISPTLAGALSQARSTQSYQGYFDWKDASGNVKNLYISVSQVEGTNLRAAVIIDAEEISAQNTILGIGFDQIKNRIGLSFLLAIAVIGGLTAIGTLLLGREITTGLLQMTDDARRIVAELPESVPLPNTNNELIILHNALTNTVKQVRNVRLTMEKQVRARTSELVRRNTQIEAIVQIAHETADVLDVKQMLTRTTQLISESFAYYHTGIFLLDEAGEYAILVATNSEGGERLLARGHKLPIEETSVVGYVAIKREIYMVNDTGADELHLRNPDLPQTRSELAIPLKVRGRMIGVLDVQSIEPNAYTQDDIKILQILADQVALSIQNARLLDESQRTLSELYNIYGQQIRQSWRQRVGDKPLAYLYTRIGVEPLDESKIPAEIEEQNAPAIYGDEGQSKMVVPISIRGQSLGSITLTRDAEQPGWSSEDLSFMQEVANQVAPALENARLLEEISRRAQTERKIGEISARIQGSLDMETVIKTAIQEVGLAIDAARVQIRLGQVGEPELTPGNGGGAVS